MGGIRSFHLPPRGALIHELAGSVGNFGTVLPLVLGVALVTEMSLGVILLFFGIWYIAIGLYYRIPVPVEPMKAIAAIVIAQGASAGEIAASGLILGGACLVIGTIGGMQTLQRWIPESVVRGIQLGLALILLRTSVNFIIPDPGFAALSIAVILVFFAVTRVRSIPDISALLVIGLGVAWGLVTTGIGSVEFLALPSLVIPTLPQSMEAFWTLVLPQFPLVLTNATLATALLAHDLYDRDIRPDTLCTSIGIMNLVSSPLGGFPMCHGAGGLAAHSRFGARSGLAMVIGGVIFLAIALFFGHPDTLAMLPVGLFGALLVFVAIEIGRHGFRTDSRPVTWSMAVVAVLFGMTAAFIWGIVLALALSRLGRGDAEA